MPNHCFNTLSITGPVKDVTAFVALVSGGKLDAFDFNTVVPMPEALKGIGKSFGGNLGITKIEQDAQLVKEYGFSNAIDWAIANWGTKWGAYDVGEWFHEGTCDGETATATITFITAWAPPDKWLEKVSTKFPTLFISDEYDVENGEDIGEVIYEAGRNLTEFANEE
jgi:hypothetical protein